MNRSPATINALTTKGLRLYVEDPRAVIKKQIKKTFWVILVTLVIAGCLVVYLVTKAKAETRSIKEKQNMINGLLNTGSSGSDFQANWQKVSPYSDQIKNALPDSSDLLGYQSSLEGIANSSGVQISLSFPSNRPKAPGNTTQTKQSLASNSLDHSVQVKGTRTAIIQFFKSVEGMPYFVQINNFTIASQANGDSVANANFKLYVK